MHGSAWKERRKEGREEGGGGELGVVLLNLRKEGKKREARRGEERKGEKRKEKGQEGKAEKVVPNIRKGDLPHCQDILDALVPSGSNLHFALFCF